MAKVKLNGTINRQRGYVSPTEADFPCPYFQQRFFTMGATDKHGVCELALAGILCDYQLKQEDGTPICARYQYCRKNEIVADAPTVSGLEPIPFVVNEPSSRVFFSKQYDDTHEKIWKIKGGELGWHHDI